MQITDMLPQFFDSIGKVLAGGRLQVYKYHTTDLVDVWLDPAYTIPASNPVNLDIGGKLSTNIYVNESITIHVQKFVGYNEFSQPVYSDVKVYDQLKTLEGGIVSSSGFLNNINELKAYPVANGLTISVTGYYTSGDCPTRSFQYDVNSNELDNGGTIIESSNTATGRWKHVTEGPTIDSRIFGVIPGVSNVNSALAGFVNHCSSVDKVAYFPSGFYSITQSGSLDINCAILSDDEVVINSTSAYTINLRNSKSILKGTFAGTNVVLKIITDLDTEHSWANGSYIPVEAFSSPSHITSGTASYNIRFTRTETIDATGTVNWNNVIVDKTLNTKFAGTFTAKSISGLGTIRVFNTTSYVAIKVPVIYASNLSNDSSTIALYFRDTTDKIYLDKPITIPNGTVISALIISSGLGTITHSGTITVSGGIEGKHNTFLSNAAVNVGYRELDGDFFNDTNGLIKSFNISSNSTLDLKTATGTEIITKSGIVKNGTLGRIAAVGGSVELYNVKVVCSDANTTSVICNNFKARDCKFETVGGANIMFSVAGSTNLIDCEIASTNASNTPGINYSWENVKVTTNNLTINITGGNCILNYVTGLANVNLIPGSNNKVTNVIIENCSVNTINFNASLMANVASAYVEDVRIRYNKGLSGNINVINQGSFASWIKAFATNNHLRVLIGDNEGANTRGTYGHSRDLLSTTVTSEYTVLKVKVNMPELLIFRDDPNTFVLMEYMDIRPRIVQEATPIIVYGNDCGVTPLSGSCYTTVYQNTTVTAGTIYTSNWMMYRQ